MAPAVASSRGPAAGQQERNLIWWMLRNFVFSKRVLCGSGDTAPYLADSVLQGVITGRREEEAIFLLLRFLGILFSEYFLMHSRV